jgi:hypothetical protein
MEEKKNRGYMREEDIYGNSAELWAKEQLEWIRHDLKPDPLLNIDTQLEAITYMMKAKGRMSIPFANDVAVEGSYLIDRIAEAVMLCVILWQDANERGATMVTGEDVKNLFKGGMPTEEQWYTAWQRQKYLGHGLENMLDVDEAYDSMKKKTKKDE